MFFLVLTLLSLAHSAVFGIFVCVLSVRNIAAQCYGGACFQRCPSTFFV